MIKGVRWIYGNEAGIIYGRDPETVLEYLKELGITHRKWYQFWKPKLEIFY